VSWNFLACDLSPGITIPHPTQGKYWDKSPGLKGRIRTWLTLPEMLLFQANELISLTPWGSQVSKLLVHSFISKKRKKKFLYWGIKECD